MKVSFVLVWAILFSGSILWAVPEAVLRQGNDEIKLSAAECSVDANHLTVKAADAQKKNQVEIQILNYQLFEGGKKDFSVVYPGGRVAFTDSFGITWAINQKRNEGSEGHFTLVQSAKGRLDLSFSARFITGAMGGKPASGFTHISITEDAPISCEIKS